MCTNTMSCPKIWIDDEISEHFMVIVQLVVVVVVSQHCEVLILKIKNRIKVIISSYFPCFMEFSPRFGLINKAFSCFYRRSSLSRKSTHIFYIHIFVETLIYQLCQFSVLLFFCCINFCKAHHPSKIHNI